MKSKYLFFALLFFSGLLFFNSNLKAQYFVLCDNLNCYPEWDTVLTKDIVSTVCNNGCIIRITYDERRLNCNGEMDYQFNIRWIEFVPSSCDCWPNEESLFKEIHKALLFRAANQINWQEEPISNKRKVAIYLPACWMKDIGMTTPPTYRRRPCTNQSETCCKIVYEVYMLGLHAHSRHLFTEPNEQICEAPCFKVCDFYCNDGYLGKIFDGKIRGDDNIDKNINYQETNTQPNPSKDNLEILFNTGNNEDVVIRIYDNTGAKINEYHYKTLTGENRYKIDVSNYSNGIYFYNIFFSERFIGNSFIVNK